MNIHTLRHFIRTKRMIRILIASCVLASVAFVADAQGVGGNYDPGQAVPPGVLNRQFQSVDEWLQNIRQRVLEVEQKFNQAQTNDPYHDARRLGALRIINNLKAELNNRQFYASQQGVAPYYHAKRFETQLNSVGFGYLNGIWKVTRCGSGMYWHMCGQLMDNQGR